MEKEIKKFVVGKCYVRPGLYGPNFLVRCTARTETTASFVERCFDDTDSPEKINIIIDGDCEACLCWTSQGHEAYIQADT